jgi:hypothetical protein
VTLLHRELTAMSGSVPTKLEGICGALLFGRRVFSQAARDLVTEVMESRLYHYQRRHSRFRRWLAAPHFPLPPNLRAEFWALDAAGARPGKRGPVVALTLLAVVPLFIFTSEFGYHVLNYVALASHHK